jgi:hypothetical protein
MLPIEVRSYDLLLRTEFYSLFFLLNYTSDIKFLNKSGSLLLYHAVTSKVPSAGQVLTIVFGMGTGVTPDRITTRNFYSSRLLIT